MEKHLLSNREITGSIPSPTFLLCNYLWKSHVTFVGLHCITKVEKDHSSCLLRGCTERMKQKTLNMYRVYSQRYYTHQKAKGKHTGHFWKTGILDLNKISG